MCGIIGIVGKQDVGPSLIEGLKRLEYRGYDSAGIATVHEGTIHRARAEGKLRNLENNYNHAPLNGHTGIGHTRWATHGAPNEVNAHPHATEKVAVVHNGIIENFKSLRDELTQRGITFTTDTDTEVIPHLITAFLEEGLTPKDAVQKTLKKLEGAFALAIIFAGDDHLLIAARRGSPLAIGYGDGEMFAGSDAVALAPLTNRIAYLEEGDMAVLTRDTAIIYDERGQQTEREVKLSHISGAAIGKSNYRHYMLKEIYEQPGVMGETLGVYCNPVSGEVTLPDSSVDLSRIESVSIIACGTSYYAGMVAKYWLETYARLPVELDIASEFRYRNVIWPENGLSLFISQSGETADTLAAMRFARQHGQQIAAIVNARESSMTQEADLLLRTLAGPEIGVASTKAFTTQLITLACLALALGRQRGVLDKETASRLAYTLAEVPSRASEVLNHDDHLLTLAHTLAEASDILYIGRGTSYPMALEGALKLKEISYIHAEGFGAGELKHGPIALVDENVPIIVLAPSDELFDKTASNMQEVAARGGKVILISDREGVNRAGDIAWETVQLPKIHPFVAPLLYAIPIQLLAYHTAVIKGTDVDQPRNLAKSVTVE